MAYPSFKEKRDPLLIKAHFENLNDSVFDAQDLLWLDISESILQIRNEKGTTSPTPVVRFYLHVTPSLYQRIDKQAKNGLLPKPSSSPPTQLPPLPSCVNICLWSATSAMPMTMSSGARLYVPTTIVALALPAMVTTTRQSFLKTLGSANYA